MWTPPPAQRMTTLMTGLSRLICCDAEIYSTYRDSEEICVVGTIEFFNKSDFCGQVLFCILLG